MDSEAFITVIKNHEDQEDGVITLVMDYKQLVATCGTVQFSHVFKEGNKCVD